MRAGATLRQVADRIGMNIDVLSRKERGILPWRDAELAAVLKALGVPTDEAKRVLDRKPNVRRKIPLFGSFAAAGVSALDREYSQGDEWILDMIDAGSTSHPRAFAITCEGDSMAPTLADKDILVCEPIEEGDEARLVDGRIVAVWRAGGGTWIPGGVMGRWRWGSNAKHATLTKDNPKYQEVAINLDAEQVQRIAVVLEARRRL